MKPPRSQMSGGTTRNAGALARARSANRTSRFLSLDSADDKLALIGPDLETAVSEFFGDEASKHLGAARRSFSFSSNSSSSRRRRWQQTSTRERRS